ncbi:MAG: hypothetical protein ABW128_21120, partial [Rhizorhabdus sp.]
LWEAVLEQLSNGGGIKGKRSEVEATRERIGTSHLRLIVVGWADAACQDWNEVREDQWDRCWDWDWIPQWLANVDWSTEMPTLKSPRLIPGKEA